jgi:hypothetical protein
MAIEALESCLELVSGELSFQGLKAYRRPHDAPFVDSSVDPGRVTIKLCLTQHDVAFDRELDSDGSLASLAG